MIAGALLDNVGSSGLLPLALAPLALNEFYIDFVAVGEDPIMTQSAFKWLSVMVALTVIPGSAVSNVVFDKIGAATACVTGNVITGMLTIVVLYIAMAEPATSTTYAIFIAALYIGFPFTVLSQLSTGPMLDRIAPPTQKGFVQGLNTTIMNFGMAVSPWLFGLLALQSYTVPNQ